MTKFRSHELVNLQGLRGLASCMVVVVHLSTLGAMFHLEKQDTNVFAVGVDLFFIISGFIMVYTTMRRKVTPVKFFFDRLIRIVPLYWFMTILASGLIIAKPQIMLSTKFTLDHLFKSLLFIPYSREDGSVMPLLFVGWTLNLEFLFYIIFAISLHMKNSKIRVVITSVILISFVMVGHIFNSHLLPELQFLTQPIILEFALGMLIGLFFERLPSTHRAGKIAIAIIIPIFLVLMLVERYSLRGQWPFSALPAGLLVTTILVAERSGYQIKHRGAILIGYASYAIYLTHPFVTQSIIFMAGKFHVLYYNLVPFLFILSLLLTVIIGVSTHFLIEKTLGRVVGKMAH